jgi:hypothetical protein
MTQSSSIGELAKALAAAQGKMRDAAYDRTNPHFRNRYATLASVRAAITPALSEHGLAVVQTTEAGAEGAVVVVTTLMHSSGEWIDGRMEMPVAKRDAQGVGSALTYARRYALAAIVGVASDEDDDGEEAVGRSRQIIATTNGEAGAQRAAIVAAMEEPRPAETEEAFAERMGAATDAAALAKVAADVHRSKLPASAKKRLHKPYSAAVARIAAAAGDAGVPS